MKRLVMVLVIALCAVTLPSLAAQQAAGPAPATGTTAAPASVSNAALPGPRLQPELRRYEPSVADSSAALMNNSESHTTIVISTLALILIVVIIVLLVSK